MTIGTPDSTSEGDNGQKGTFHSVALDWSPEVLYNLGVTNACDGGECHAFDRPEENRCRCLSDGTHLAGKPGLFHSAVLY